MTTLLPPNATAMERALEAAGASISDVPVRVREVWSPDDCPAALLPWLAWAFLVDGWDVAWTEQQKRDSIKAAYYVHSHRGTAAAMRASLNALGLGLQVVEWFDQEPAGEPYTFRVKLDVEQSGAGQADLQRALAAINAAKNLRSHLAGLDLTVVSRADPAPCFAGVVLSGHDITIAPGV